MAKGDSGPGAAAEAGVADRRCTRASGREESRAQQTHIRMWAHKYPNSAHTSRFVSSACSMEAAIRANEDTCPVDQEECRFMPDTRGRGPLSAHLRARSGLAGRLPLPALLACRPIDSLSGEAQGCVPRNALRNGLHAARAQAHGRCCRLCGHLCGVPCDLRCIRPIPASTDTAPEQTLRRSYSVRQHLARQWPSATWSVHAHSLQAACHCARTHSSAQRQGCWELLTCVLQCLKPLCCRPPAPAVLQPPWSCRSPQLPPARQLQSPAQRLAAAARPPAACAKYSATFICWSLHRIQSLQCASCEHAGCFSDAAGSCKETTCDTNRKPA